MTGLAQLLLSYQGKRASVNPRESEDLGGIVIDVEPMKPPDKSIVLIHKVTSDLLALDYFDMQEMHYIPLDKIIKVNVILRENR